MFCGKDGEVLKENDTITFPQLAKTYRKIAEEGADAFYEGELAQNLVTDIQAAGSVFAVLFELGKWMSTDMYNQAEVINPIVPFIIKPEQTETSDSKKDEQPYSK